MVSETIKREILRLDNEGKKPKAIRMELGLSRGVVAGILDRWKGKDNAVRDVQPLHSPKPIFSVLPKPQIVKRAENGQTDIKEWQSRLRGLFKAFTYIKLAHMNDLHLPGYDAKALDLWFKIMGMFQPHIVVVGSDMLDLPTISRFEPDPEINIDDWQESSREHYWPIIHRLDSLLPNAVIVWIYGNHERRALDAIKKSDSPKTNMNHFIETVRCGGRVLHLGRTEHIEVGNLIITHGNKASKYAAASIGAMWPDKVVNFGHIHRHQSVGNAFSNGMLGEVTPHYDDWGYPNTQEQGTSTMTVESKTGAVNWNYHPFVSSGGVTWAMYGNEILTATKAITKVRAA